MNSSQSQSIPGSITIVGTGLAGTRMAACLRELGYHGNVTIVGADEHPGYDKPPLSKELLSRDAPAWFHEELDLHLREICDEVILGDPAVLWRPATENTSTGQHLITLASGREIGSAAVIFAVGSEPIRVVGWDNALTLGTHQDAAHLKQIVEEMSGADTLGIVGAGWIGAEVAGVVAATGRRVVVVESDVAPLVRVLGARVGRIIAQWYADAGVTLITGTAVQNVTNGGIELADGQCISTIATLSAVGARRATSWLPTWTDEQGSLPTDPAGQLLSPRGEVVAGVYAVGDCAARTDPLWGKIPGGHWTAALHDPNLIAQAILELAPTTGHLPYVFSVQLGHDVGLVGLPSPSDDVVLRGDPASGPWAAGYFKEGKLMAVFGADNPREVSQARKILAHGPVRASPASFANATEPLRRIVATAQ